MCRNDELSSTMSWVGEFTIRFNSTRYMKVKRMEITDILIRIWLFLQINEIWLKIFLHFVLKGSLAFMQQFKFFGGFVFWCHENLMNSLEFVEFLFMLWFHEHFVYKYSNPSELNNPYHTIYKNISDPVHRPSVTTLFFSSFSTGRTSILFHIRMGQKLRKKLFRIGDKIK